MTKHIPGLCRSLLALRRKLAAMRWGDGEQASLYEEIRRKLPPLSSVPVMPWHHLS
jgi:hypothetical protein